MVGLFPVSGPWSSRGMDLRRGPGRPRNDEPGAPSKRVDVKIPLQLLERLEAIARARHMTRHLAIREAILEWVARRDREPGPGAAPPVDPAP